MSSCTCNPQDNEVEPLESWFHYVGEPRLDESRRMYLERDPPNILGYYHHRMLVFQGLSDHYEHDPFSLEYRVYTGIVEVWRNRIQHYNQDREILERMESGWYHYRIRHPLDETIEQGNRRLYPSLYAVQEEVVQEEVVQEEESDDDISLYTQPDENVE